MARDKPMSGRRGVDPNLSEVLRSAFPRTDARDEFRQQLIRTSLNILAERLRAAGRSAAHFQEAAVRIHRGNSLETGSEIYAVPELGSRRVNQLRSQTEIGEDETFDEQQEQLKGRQSHER